MKPATGTENERLYFRESWEPPTIQFSIKVTDFFYQGNLVVERMLLNKLNYRITFRSERWSFAEIYIVKGGCFYWRTCLVQ